jgi:hypothetical protein
LIVASVQGFQEPGKSVNPDVPIFFGERMMGPTVLVNGVEIRLKCLAKFLLLCLIRIGKRIISA